MVQGQKGRSGKNLQKGTAEDTWDRPSSIAADGVKWKDRGGVKSARGKKKARVG